MKVARFIAILLVSLTALASGACGEENKATPANATAPQQEQSVSLRFINSWGGGDPKAETLQEVLDGFMEKNPGISVSNESLFGEDFLLKLKTDFASGNDPDVFGLWPGSDIQLLVGVGKVADLSGVLDEDPDWKSRFDPKFWSYTTYGGEIYGLPVELIFEGLFINTDLFRRYDVKVPSTYEELKDAVVKFHQHGIIPIAFNCKAEGTYLYQNMAMMLGGRKAIENPIKNGTIDKCYITALYRLCELHQLGAFPEDLYTMTSAERNDLFRDKHAAMIVQGSWYVSALSDDRNVEIVPFPEMKDGEANYTSMVYGLGCGSFYMSQRAWDNPVKREASLKLLKHLTSSDTVTVFAENTGMLSCVDISSSHVRYSRLAQAGIDYISTAKDLIGPPDSYLPRTTWENVIVTYLPYVLEGQMSPEELWSMALGSDDAKEGVSP